MVMAKMFEGPQRLSRHRTAGSTVRSVNGTTIDRGAHER
jgi:hypothetical protein